MGSVVKLAEPRTCREKAHLDGRRFVEHLKAEDGIGPKECRHDERALAREVPGSDTVRARWPRSTTVRSSRRFGSTMPTSRAEATTEAKPSKRGVLTQRGLIRTSSKMIKTRGRTRRTAEQPLSPCSRQTAVRSMQRRMLQRRGVDVWPEERERMLKDRIATEADFAGPETDDEGDVLFRTALGPRGCTFLAPDAPGIWPAWHRVQARGLRRSRARRGGSRRARRVRNAPVPRRVEVVTGIVLAWVRCGRFSCAQQQRRSCSPR